MPAGDTTGFLRYQVPDHQDQTVLRAALAKEGYGVTSSFEQAVTMLTIAYAGAEGEHRERVRQILAGEHDAALGGPKVIFGPVRFEDEPGDGPRAVPPPEARVLAEQLVASQDGAPRSVRASRPALATKVLDRATVSLGVAPLFRASWGLVLLTATDSVCRMVAVAPTPRSRFVVRALGARHVAWAGLATAAPTRRTTWLGVAVDSAHALTAVAYAASAPERRRAGLASAGVATAFALDGIRRARSAPAPGTIASAVQPSGSPS